MDYNFLTIERFMELEKSGALLESGTYEGELPGDGGKGAVGIIMDLHGKGKEHGGGGDDKTVEVPVAPPKNLNVRPKSAI